jgi:hypothetical protein
VILEWHVWIARTPLVYSRATRSGALYVRHIIVGNTSLNTVEVRLHGLTPLVISDV